MSEEAVEAKVALFQNAEAALATLRARERGSNSARAFWVPGRVEFLGKHTDYAGGRSLLCAIERGICIVALPRSDRRLRIADARIGEVVEGTVDPYVRATDGHWSTYPFTVARRIARDFGEAESLVGADIAFASDLPAASGMSSSSALVVATFLALADVNGLASRDLYQRVFPRTDVLAGYLGAVENGYAFEAFAGDTGVGTFGGSEDHTAILCARPDALIQYSFCPVRFERQVPLPKDHELVLASCGVVAEKIGGAREAYNRLSRSTQELAARWRETTGRGDATLGDALASSPDGAARLLAMASDCDAELRERLEQFVHESAELIPGSGDALLRGDLSALGDLVDRSQAGAERLLKNQIEETIRLVRDARNMGATAASAFGAGFGGAVWALVPSAEALPFKAQWSERYKERFPSAAAKASFFVTRAGPAATRI
ncbi:MAG TPA: galactokinase family protein [Gemmatimonadaceae bacterium]|nr:galactokinase family protein [Gemmatimonadaceae bacterium]